MALSPSEIKWLNSSKGYLLAKMLEDDYDERISRLTSTSFDMEKLCISPQTGFNYCKFCEVEHQIGQEKSGPRNFDWMKLQRRNWQKVDALQIIGYLWIF